MLSDLALEVVGDAAIVWLLSPKAAIGPRPAGGLSRLTSSLPGYFLQVGAPSDEAAACRCAASAYADGPNVHPVQSSLTDRNSVQCRSGTTQWRSA